MICISKDIRLDLLNFHMSKMDSFSMCWSPWNEGELEKASVWAKFAYTAADGYSSILWKSINEVN